MKLLIIEGEEDLLQRMTRFLKKEGCRCEQATTFREGYKKINNYEYDCVIIDLVVPGGNGLQLVETLRNDDTDTGIILIADKNTVEDRVTGLDSGADDYLGKPFHLSELNARIKAVVRRKTRQFSKILQFEGLALDLDKREVRAQGELLQLTKKEYEILLYLARNKNRVITKDSIAEHLWGDYMDEAVSFDFIYAHVKNLRKKLAAGGCGDLLKTVYGIGYKFQAS